MVLACFECNGRGTVRWPGVDRFTPCPRCGSRCWENPIPTATDWVGFE